MIHNREIANQSKTTGNVYECAFGETEKTQEHSWTLGGWGALFFSRISEVAAYSLRVCMYGSAVSL